MREPEALERREYEFAWTLFGSTKDIDDFLNEYARQGWELHSWKISNDGKFDCVFQRLIFKERTKA